MLMDVVLARWIFEDEGAFDLSDMENWRSMPMSAGGGAQRFDRWLDSISIL
jgi:hypothetical protein